MKEITKRINELANKSKTIGLTEEEKVEQQDLRKQYLAKFRGNMENTLLNLKVVDPEGVDVTPEKLKMEQERYKK